MTFEQKKRAIMLKIKTTYQTNLMFNLALSHQNENKNLPRP